MSKVKEIELGGVRFRQDFRPGPERHASTADVFTLVKSDALLGVYRDLVPRAPRAILELGMFEGGALVFFDKLFQPERIVGVDIRAEPIAALEEYRRDNPHVRALYGTSQDDPGLAETLAREFPSGIDLVVDDASHAHDLSRESFRLCFPLLNRGGLYVIEGWSWSQTAACQDPGHPRHGKRALADLVLELVLAVPVASEIAQVTVHPKLVVLEKGAAAGTGFDLDLVRHTLRGRPPPQV